MKGTQRGGSTGMTGGVAWRRAATRAQRRRGGAGRRAGGNGPGRFRTSNGTRGRSRRDPRDGQRAGEWRVATARGTENVGRWGRWAGTGLARRGSRWGRQRPTVATSRAREIISASLRPSRHAFPPSPSRRPASPASPPFSSSSSSSPSFPFSLSPSPPFPSPPLSAVHTPVAAALGLWMSV